MTREKRSNTEQRRNGGSQATQYFCFFVSVCEPVFSVISIPYRFWLVVVVSVIGSLNARYSPEYAPPLTATTTYCLPST